MFIFLKYTLYIENSESFYNSCNKFNVDNNRFPRFNHDLIKHFGRLLVFATFLVMQRLPEIFYSIFCDLVTILFFLNFHGKCYLFSLFPIFFPRHIFVVQNSQIDMKDTRHYMIRTLSWIYFKITRHFSIHKREKNNFFLIYLYFKKYTHIHLEIMQVNLIR